MNASGLLGGGETMETLFERLQKEVRDVCGGKKTCAELNGHREGTLFFNYQHPNRVIPHCY
ncbi:UxaA family hydrolase [Parablautia sp. Marseille-Q6255]|uniref:UxaA family hydrolase n=1 Tax=Parablautia sp. Marseille-Q6255 TaxID=3039593 RepID=UPI0024BC8700|nr:UxaA family hydrolase [Parablautia sp. Marseille-Q6255]